MITMDDLLTVEEVAQKLKMHPDTVARLLRAGKIPAYKLEGSWRVKQSDLDQYVEDRKYIRKKN